MELKRKIAAVVATGALLFSSIATPAFATTTIQITGNGTDSENDAVITTTNTTTVVQSNDANISNNVDVDADTGDNEASDNTGGNISIETGDVDTEVTVSNTVNSNSAEVDCCQTGDTEVLISGNGSDSDNKVELEQSKETAVFQSNNADIDNDVDVDADTGDNEAEDNTGGDVEIKTGDVDTEVTVSNSGNVNSAQVGGDNNGGGSLSAWITGNGSDSKNGIKLALGNLTELIQSNNADIDNDVDVDADTGDNEAEDNTGGYVSIETGDVDATVEIDNMVNFNAADVDCGCLLSDLLAKISGNGTDSKNKIEAELSDELLAFQGNCEENAPYSEGGDRYEKCGLDNDVDVDGDTGYNEAEDNTGNPGGDPSVETGDVDATVDLENSGNMNVFGDTGDLELPDFDFDLDISLDLSDLLGVLLGLLG